MRSTEMATASAPVAPRREASRQRCDVVPALAGRRPGHGDDVLALDLAAEDAAPPGPSAQPLELARVAVLDQLGVPFERAGIDHQRRDGARVAIGGVERPEAPGAQSRQDEPLAVATRLERIEERAHETAELGRDRTPRRPGSGRRRRRSRRSPRGRPGASAGPPPPPAVRPRPSRQLRPDPANRPGVEEDRGERRPRPIHGLREDPEQRPDLVVDRERRLADPDAADVEERLVAPDDRASVDTAVGRIRPGPGGEPGIDRLEHRNGGSNRSGMEGHRAPARPGTDGHLHARPFEVAAKRGIDRDTVVGRAAGRDADRASTVRPGSAPRARRRSRPRGRSR